MHPWWLLDGAIPPSENHSEVRISCQVLMMLVCWFSYRCNEWVSKLGGLGRDRDGILLSGSTTMIRLLCAFLGRCLEGNLMVGIGLRVRVLERLICESLHLPQLFDYDGSNQAARWIWQNFNA